MKGTAQVLSFRCPVAVIALLDAEVAKRPEGIASRADALNDALVIWLMLEGENDGAAG